LLARCLRYVSLPSLTGFAVVERLGVGWCLFSSVSLLCVDARLLVCAAGVPSACQRPGHFLFQEKVTKEKQTPSTRFAGCARKVRGGITGFFDRASCPDEKLAGIHASHPAG
jgi:hypothetical protein